MNISHNHYAARLAVLVLALGLAACAAVRHTPASLAPVPAAAPAASRTLAQAVAIDLDTGYSRQLKAGSNWQRTGTIAQGDVYRPVGDVFTLEGAHIHEAWLVVREDTLVGFYLPAERGFSSLRAPLPLHFTR